jgi:hypothetical protein
MLYEDDKNNLKVNLIKKTVKIKNKKAVLGLKNIDVVRKFDICPKKW